MESETSRRPSDAEKTRVVKGGKLLDEEGRRVFDNPEAIILKTDADVAALGEEAAVLPYSDPALRSRTRMVELTQKPNAAGLITHRRRRRCSGGVFTVAKKGDALRLTVDCRAVNVLCPPPVTELASPSAYGSIDWSDAALGRKTGGEPKGPIFFSGLDLTDGFCQLMGQHGRALQLGCRVARGGSAGGGGLRPRCSAA